MERRESEVESKEELIARLKEEHAQLEEAIQRIEQQASWSVSDEAEIRRLKKLKLRKKDLIAQLTRSA